MFNGANIDPNEGIRGGSLKLIDTTNGYLLLPHEVLDGKGTVTLSIWGKSRATWLGFQSLISGANPSNNNEYLLGITPANIAMYTGQSTGSLATFTTDISQLLDDEWHHYVWVRDQENGRMQLYVDNVKVYEGATTLQDLEISPGGLLLGQEQDTVGGAFDVSQRFRGHIDEVNLYDRVLAPDEIQELYRQDPSGVAGHLSHDTWLGIEGLQVDDLFNHAKFYQAPDISELIAGAENSLGQNSYGSRLRGTITAPVSGSYTFWVAGDDGVEMWLSSDERKFNRQRIAWHTGSTNSRQWDKFATQQSAPVCLQAGQKYYLEILHKENFGSDHVSVAWSYEADDLINFAREPGAVASQSTTSSGGVASRAIDGNTNGVFSAGSVTHTANTAQPNWWQVDLGVDRAVERVILYNRTGSGNAPRRLSNFRISVLDAAGNEVVGQNYHTEDGYVEGSLVCELANPAIGRTLRVSLLGQNLQGDTVLSLAEVAVMGSESGAGSATPLGYLTNWTQEAGVTASQSTTTFGAGASRAIDGNRNGDFNTGSVTHTDAGSLGNWWQTDLGLSRKIDRITIYNRTDSAMTRLSNFRVIVLNSAGAEVMHKDFYTEEGHGGYKVQWDLPAGVLGQRVRIENLGPNRAGDHVLSFAEVEVLSLMEQFAGAIRAQEVLPAAVLESYVPDPDDLDDDGLPNAWEIQYGFNPNSNESDQGGSFRDPDGDFIANWQEYQLGTDPTTPNSIIGALSEEVWTGVPGTDLQDFYEHSKYLQNADYRRLLSTSEGTRHLGDFTATRIRGFIEAPVSGEYCFWLSGDDEVKFWMSDSEDKFSKELLIRPHLHVGFRNYDEELSQKSRVVTLVAGQKYYIELQHKENTGGGLSPVSMVWQAPGGERELIPGEYLYNYIRDANDQDDDGLPDDFEIANGLDPNDNGFTNPANGYFGDLDGDGLANHEELEFGTRADLTDTDGDGINDFDEAAIFEADALAENVAPFQPVQIVNGSSYKGNLGGWRTNGSFGTSAGVRGWVEYEINVPTAGVFLLDAVISPALSGILSDQYKMDFSIDGHAIGNVTTTAANGETGSAKILTPWLTAGIHTVRIFNDNALTYRRVNIQTLELLSAQGDDNNSNGIPDWVETRLSNLNGIETPVTQSRVSPVSIEGRARYTDLVSLSTGSAVTPLAGDRWMADVALNSQSSVNLQTSLENGGVIANQSIEWIPTNLLSETAMTLTQGDALRLTAYNGGSASHSDEVWVTVGGETHHFTGDQPMEWHFDTAGVHTFNVVHRQSGNTQETTNTVTVTVVAPITIESPVCVPTHARKWNVPELPAGAILEIDDRVEIRKTEVLAEGVTCYTIETETADTYYANVRMGVGGPILQSIAIRGMTVRDAEHTSIVFARDFGDGSYRVNMQTVVDNLYPDVAVRYDLFIGGTTFDNDASTKDYFFSDFDDLGQTTVSFFKTGAAGSACHRTSVWQGDTIIAFFF